MEQELLSEMSAHISDSGIKMLVWKTSKMTGGFVTETYSFL